MTKNSSEFKNPPLYLYNSLTRKKEEFKAFHPPNVSMYTCGPTVYDNLQIGNMRTYVLADVLRRILEFNGYKVRHVMNITDVGHLSGDNLGDSSQGEDRLERGAKREGQTAWDIAKKYEESFKEDAKKLQLQVDEYPRATDHIKEQIKLIEELEKNGYTYKISDGIYFDTSKFEQYGAPGDLDQIKEGARVEPNPEKKNPSDFALWKFSKEGKRDMEWNSPWGIGFPGWSIECSAMSMKCLTDAFAEGFNPSKFSTLDIHVGGEDLKQTHHPNEVAQSEGATGKKFVNYWVHGTFLLVDGGRMGKSLGNAYNMADIEEKGFYAKDLRYLFYTAHYKTPLNFTWDALEGAKKSLARLRKECPNVSERNRGNPKKGSPYLMNFFSAINDDLNMPRALAVVWELMENSSVEDSEKAILLSEFDKVLALDIYANEKESLEETSIPIESLPKDVRQKIADREDFRKQKKFAEADGIRKQIEDLGYQIKDTKDGVMVKRSN